MSSPSAPSPRVAPFADVRDIGALLQRAGFALPVTDVETVKVRYGDAFALCRDLRAMGATNALLARRRSGGRAPADGGVLGTVGCAEYAQHLVGVAILIRQPMVGGLFVMDARQQPALFDA